MRNLLQKITNNYISFVVGVYLSYFASCVLYHNNANAIEMSVDRKKNNIDFAWNINLGSFITHQTLMPSGNNSVVSLIPRIDFSLVRNFTDRAYLIFYTGGGAPYVNIGSDNSTQAAGLQVYTMLGGGFDIISKNNYSISLIGGVDFRYFDFRTSGDNVSVQSNATLGSFGWFGVGFNIDLDRVHSLNILTRFGLGYFGISFGHIDCYNFVSAFGLLGSIRLQHDIKVLKLNNVFWFIQGEVPFFNAFENNTSYNSSVNNWFDQSSVSFGVGIKTGI